MELRQLAYFVAIADERSISAAARRLHMSQPPLTAVVMALERELGTPLLKRHPRGVKPTPAGHHLVASARRLLADATAAADAVRSLGTGATGVLTLGAVPSAGWELMPRLLGRYLEQFPDVHIELQDLPGPVAAIEAVRQRRVEAGILYTSDPVALTSRYADDLSAHVVRREHMVLLAPAAAGWHGRVSVRDLRRETWLTTATHPAYPGLNQALHEVWRVAGVMPPVQTVPTMGTARTFVRAGIGIAPVIASAVTGLPPAVAVLTTIEQFPDLHGMIIRLRRETPSKALENLIKIVHDRPLSC
jgi:DNA-binding transcriptional LysR family regulator